MNDPRDGYLYGCWIQSTNTTAATFTLNNRFLLYVTGEYVRLYNFMMSHISLYSLVNYNAKQKHPGCKKSSRPIRSSTANRYVQPKTLISVEAKKLLIKNLFNYLNDIQ